MLMGGDGIGGQGGQGGRVTAYEFRNEREPDHSSFRSESKACEFVLAGVVRAQKRHEDVRHILSFHSYYV